MERNINQYIKSAGMGSANTLEIEPNSVKKHQRSDVNKQDQIDSVDNMNKSFNQSALAGVNL